MRQCKSEILSVKVNWNFEIALTLAGLIFTNIAVFFLWKDMGGVLAEKQIAGHSFEVWEQCAFMMIVLGLIYGNVVYQLSRLGFLVRDKSHVHDIRPDTSYLFDNTAPEVTILVPSYREELKVIYQTLMSAALQQYRDKRVVLLIDDPPFPTDVEDQDTLEATRELIYEISSFLAVPNCHYQDSKEKCLLRLKKGITDLVDEAMALAECYEDAAQLLNDLATYYRVADHTDHLFVQKILRDPAKDLRRHALSIKNRAGFPSTCLDKREIIRGYNRIIGMFSAEISFFERKRYENLSHEKNKAMNLNTYIGMIGKNYCEDIEGGKRFLVECSEKFATLSVPDAEFIITLDADSLILPDYVARLVDVMMRPGNEKLAVVQTPYSAIPGTSNVLERVAGATTDIQLLIHQGFAAYNATFWVGANALLRKIALEDIKIVEEDRGYPVTRYIQDRTVIEDTESSIDLVDAGWLLHNYPARLAYSATPPDYGSLLIQRRRWANGGLIIMPKLIRHVIRKFSLKKLSETFVRLHYLISIALSSIGVLALILYPFEDVMRTAWLPLSAIPYFYLYARDLRLSGYRWGDLFRVYALNLMLIPINIGGVLKSVQQGVLRKKIDFSRTPKVDDRTAAPSLYVLLTFTIFAYCLISAPVDILQNRPLHGTFAAVNAIFFFYVCTYFVGWRTGLEDMMSGLLPWRKVRDTTVFPAMEQIPDSVYPSQNFTAKRERMEKYKRNKGQVSAFPPVR